MVDRPLEQSIAYTFHLEGKNMITRARCHQRAVQLGEALATLNVWHDQQVNEGIASYFNKDSWKAIIKGLTADIQTLNKLAQEGE